MVIGFNEGKKDRCSCSLPSAVQVFQSALCMMRLGRRKSKTINGVTTQYQYDGNDIVAEIGGGAVGASYLRSLNIDEPFIRQSNSTEYYHTDALGSVFALTDQTGAVQTTYRYDPFGNTTITGTSSNPFQYTGRENDRTGLYYYRARYYNPVIQRFVSQDPLTFPINFRLLQAIGLIDECNSRIQGEAYARAVLSAIGSNIKEFHPYTYVNNNPLAANDPSGLGPVSECIKYTVDCFSGTSGYACVAQVVCFGAELVSPGGAGINCFRNCLLSEYENSDKSASEQIIPHATCAACCGSGRKDCGSAGGL
ncbi:MAG: RHS repeat-associated core domain-containing protein [Nitrospirae bacterium]|nr:RHS repeat-associated core domain-containing protein [Nitrospirota bacterium]